MQIIDTSFQIQKAGESKIVGGTATLSVQDLDDPERLAAYLATVCGLPEEDCLVALKECETQLLAIRAEFEQSLANDAESIANVFIDNESSPISRVRRWQSSVEELDFEHIIPKTDEDEDEWKSRKQAIQESRAESYLPALQEETSGRETPQLLAVPSNQQPGRMRRASAAAWSMLARQNTNDSIDAQAGPSQEYDSRIIDMLDLIGES